MDELVQEIIEKYKKRLKRTMENPKQNRDVVQSRTDMIDNFISDLRIIAKVCEPKPAARPILYYINANNTCFFTGVTYTNGQLDVQVSSDKLNALAFTDKEEAEKWLEIVRIQYPVAGIEEVA